MTLSFQLDGQTLSVHCPAGAPVELTTATGCYRFEALADGRYQPLDSLHGLTLDGLLVLQAAHFSQSRQPFELWLPSDTAWLNQALRAGLVAELTSEDGRCLLANPACRFWQNPRLWLVGASSSHIPLQYQLTQGRRHPARAAKAEGEVYRRYFANLNSSFSLRAVDIDQDLALFHEWQNREKVAEFWQQTGSLDEQRAYLQQQQQDPHTQTLIGCFDDEPFAYFEAYWAKEDRIAPFYPADDYDRGLHTLIGNRKYQSPLRLKAWLNGIFHYLFLDDLRTQRLMGEPRIDNERHIANLQRQGLAKLREFDFPHKRAALLWLEREVFFEQSPLWD